MQTDKKELKISNYVCLKKSNYALFLQKQHLSQQQLTKLETSHKEAQGGPDVA